MWKMLLWVAVLGMVHVPKFNYAAANGNQLTKKSASTAEEGRIINGILALPGQFPFACAIYSIGNICTASIISRTTVLTAAHCVTDAAGVPLDASLFYGAAGSVARSSPRLRMNFTRIFVHPKFNSSTLANDVAIMKLSSPITFNFFVKPVCIAKTEFFINFKKLGVATGWGLTEKGADPETTPATEHLRYALLGVTPASSCRSIYNEYFTDNNICATGINQGICFGDSGGPLVHECLLTQRPLQSGVASYVSGQHGCGATIGGNSVYARVTSFADWILSVSNDRSICYI